MPDNELRQRNRRETDPHSLDVLVITGVRTLAKKVQRYATFFNPARILKLERDREQYYKEARTDALTGIGNRRFYEEKGQKLDDLCTQGELQTYSIAVIDVDFFKEVNDKYGHDVGDKVLKGLADEFARELSNILKTELRTELRKTTKLPDFVARYDKKEDEPTDLVVARYGGEEFVVMLPETNIDQAKIAMERVRKRIEGTVIKYQMKVEEIYGGQRGIDITRTISVGVAEKEANKTYEEVFSDADLRAYMAKSMGRNRVVNQDIGGKQLELFD